jgi:RNA polymerase sigma factor (TIGR02999 family)
MELPAADITQLLIQMNNGDSEAEARLMRLVYAELRRLAAYYMRQERMGHSLAATDLVHEAYLRLVGQRDDWKNRGHFFGVAAQMMRRILVDHARAKAAERRGGGCARISLDEALVFSEQPSIDFLALDQALSRLAEWDPRQSRIVELIFFSGLTEDEVAIILDISSRTVKRDWSMAKAWLYKEMNQ